MNKTEPFSATWIVDAPWAHSFWDTYALLLLELTTEVPGEPPSLLAEGVTHELTVFALDPKKSKDLPRGQLTEQQVDEIVQKHKSLPLLLPANHVYQFVAANDESAAQRISFLAAAISEQRLNPDTDGRQQWHDWFADGLHPNSEGVKAKEVQKAFCPECGRQFGTGHKFDCSYEANLSIGYNPYGH